MKPKTKAKIEKIVGALAGNQTGLTPLEIRAKTELTRNQIYYCLRIAIATGQIETALKYGAVHYKLAEDK